MEKLGKSRVKVFFHEIYIKKKTSNTSQNLYHTKSTRVESLVEKGCFTNFAMYYSLLFISYKIYSLQLFAFVSISFVAVTLLNIVFDFRKDS